MKTSKIKVNGIEMRYLDMPNEGEETVIFLHYGGATLAVWNGVIPFFKDNYRIIATDLRGHGFSEKPDSNYHIDDMAKDVAELMEKLSVEKAYIVGSSLGADIAISIAANYPEKVISMALDGGYYDLAGPDSKEQIITKEDISKSMKDLKEKITTREQKFFDSKEEFLNHYKKGWEKYFPWDEIARIATEDDMYQTEDGKYTTHQTGEIIWKYCEPLYDLRFEDYYSKIKCPVLLLPDAKEENHEIVKRNLEKYQKYLSHSKVVVIEGSVHAYTCLLKPKEFSETVLEFIKDVKG